MSYKVEINRGDFLLRNIHHTYIIEEEGEISPFAYRPRLDQGKDPDGVSIGVEKLFKDEDDIRNNFWFKNRWCVYKVLADVAFDHSYNCIHDHARHGLITGDMDKLFTDMDTLLDLASNSKFVLRKK